MAPPPTTRAMDEHRLSIGRDAGSEWAVNGVLKSVYGKEGTPVPSHVATIHSEDLDPIAQVVADWLMDPFLDYVSKPFRSVLSKLPLVGKRFKRSGSGKKFVSTSAITAIAKVSITMTVIVFLSGAIALLDIVENTKRRILLIMLFAQVFAVSVQFVGSRSIPTYMLIIA